MKENKKQFELGLIFFLLLIGLLFVRSTGEHKDLPYVSEMTAAAENMGRCEKVIRRERLARGIPLSEEDYLKIGLLGQSSSPITTTIGTPDAKRTSELPDMAALCVRLFREAGVKEGDRIGACYSGSFPGLNLAVICAADAIGADLVYISSVGASSYGGNIPEYTAPEMLNTVYEAGLISKKPAAVTLGGDNDCGDNMVGVLLGDEEPILKAVRRLEQEELPLMAIEDYEENLKWRMEVYGDIDCFVNVGGNAAGVGKGEKTYEGSQGLLRDLGEPLTKRSGLLERCLRQGIPSIQLLNIKELCLEYGIQYDPSEIPPVGREGVYRKKAYSKSGAAAVGILTVLGLGCVSAADYFRTKSKGERDVGEN